MVLNQFIPGHGHWRRLGWALAASLVLHALLVALLTSTPAREKQNPRPERVDVRLRAAAPPAPASTPEPAPKLVLPKKKPAAGSSSASTSNASAPRMEIPQRGAAAGGQPRDGVPQTLAGEAATAAYLQMARLLNYPREAVEQGLEGEATVLLFLDADGKVLAARLEASSGHALLDDAAVRAARSLHSLPDSAPREALLPVRFRLR